MRHTLIAKNLEVTAGLRQIFEAKVAELDRLTPTFSNHLVSLQTTVEKNLKRGDFATSVSLHFPQQTLHAEAQNRDVQGAIRIDRFKSRLRREHRWVASKYD